MINFKEMPRQSEEVDIFEERKGDPPCRSNCPANVNAAAYVGLIAMDRFDEALDVIRQKMPFPGVCGRVCHHPCEDECNREEHDDPVSIAALKRAAAEYGRRENEKVHSVKEIYGYNVAIIGSGPAGLTAAYDLKRKGHRVTLFDKGEKPGGMIRAAIPFYRLPEEVVDQDIEDVLSSGIDLRLNTEIGKDVTMRELEMYYDSVLIAVGTQKSAILRLEGIENEGVYWGLDFLRRAKSAYKPQIGNSVLVVGGGNVAVDVARTSLRLGADRVNLCCLENMEEMPAHSWEVEPAVEEGMIINNRLGPKRIIGDSDEQVEGIEMVKVSSVFDDEGKFNPQFIDDSELFLKADTVIIAIGQTADLEFLESVKGVEQTPRKLLDADEVTLETGRMGIFACGDVVSGPTSIVEAVNAGHEAADSIHRFLIGYDMREGREDDVEELAVPEGIPIFDYERQVPEEPEAEVRRADFREEKYVLTREQAIAEAKRCLNCGNCYICGEECTINVTGGICPIIRCSKSAANGPCGGSFEGQCEVDENEDCGWQLISDLLEREGALANVDDIMLPKCWSYLENKYLENTAASLRTIRDAELLEVSE